MKNFTIRNITKTPVNQRTNTANQSKRPTPPTEPKAQIIGHIKALSTGHNKPDNKNSKQRGNKQCGN
jgi:hypothetical protein